MVESWRGLGWTTCQSSPCTVNLDKSLSSPMVFPFLSVKNDTLWQCCGNETQNWLPRNRGAQTERKAMRQAPRTSGAGRPCQ